MSDTPKVIPIGARADARKRQQADAEANLGANMDRLREALGIERPAAPVTKATGEVRVTSETGGAKGTKPQRWDLVPPEAVEDIAEVLAFGAQKYDAHNWRRGYAWSLSYAALMRHMAAFWRGETYDPETGLPHIAHAGCHVFFMLTWLKEQGEGSRFDDRPHVTMGREQQP